MSGGGASDIIQRRALDKQLVETVEKYAKPEMSVLTLDNQLLPRKSEAWQKIEEKITAIAATNANAIIFGECGLGKEQVAPKSTSTVRVSRNLTLSLKPGVPVSSACMTRHQSAVNFITASRATFTEPLFRKSPYQKSCAISRQRKNFLTRTPRF